MTQPQPQQTFKCSVCGQPMVGFKPPAGSTQGLQVSHGKCALQAAFQARGQVPPPGWKL